MYASSLIYHYYVKTNVYHALNQPEDPSEWVQKA